MAVDRISECMGLFDSHAHYFDKRFDDETPGADYILENEVFGVGVDGVINAGTNLSTSRMCIKQAKKYENMFATVGIHPEDVAFCDNVESDMEAIFLFVKDSQTIMQNKIVAIGEIGYDYHYENYDKELQRQYFESQLILAQKVGLPVVIHNRDAHADSMEMIKKHPGVRGVFHSFSGSVEIAKELISLGFYISFSGVLTFKNARKAVEVARAIPLERILIETDAPYLAPSPHRGHINHSGLIIHTASKLAEIKETDLQSVAWATRKNVKELFGI